jgi:hypothetical protein
VPSSVHWFPTSCQTAVGHVPLHHDYPHLQGSRWGLPELHTHQTAFWKRRTSQGR